MTKEKLGYLETEIVQLLDTLPRDQGDAAPLRKFLEDMRELIKQFRFEHDFRNTAQDYAKEVAARNLDLEREIFSLKAKLESLRDIH